MYEHNSQKGFWVPIRLEDSVNRISESQIISTLLAHQLQKYLVLELG